MLAPRYPLPGTLDDIVASALGQKPRADLAVLLPRFAAWDRADESAQTTSKLRASRRVAPPLHTVARHCQQVLAGIDFTAEHSFHRFLKRVLALVEGIVGSADAIVLDIGRRLLAECRVPTLIEL